ncbi:MAG: hypothetical protein FGM62_04045 [Methylobacterium sp.]|nr:hypothetical protein [Methylobacterium sp.]
MKRLMQLLMFSLLLSGPALADEAKPGLVIYIAPNEYSHDVRLGIIPVYIIWARNGPPLERAARTALQPHFSQIDLCQGSNAGDAVVWLKPELRFSALYATYSAEVTAQFYRADGKPIGTLRAIGYQQSTIGTLMIQEHVQMAYNKAMQEIARLYAADTALQQAIDPAAGKSPCAMVPLIPVTETKDKP